MTEKRNIEVDYLWKFTDRKDGDVRYSRHEKPDFVYGMTEEQINKIWEVEKVTDEKEIEKNLMGYKK